MAILSLSYDTTSGQSKIPTLHRPLKEASTVENEQCLFSGSSPIWKLLSSFSWPLAGDAAFWWRSTGTFLAEALYQAQYSLADQLNALNFFYSNLIARLGPRPFKNLHAQRWKSFMTDDFSPVEISWNWGTGAKPPDVRYSIEAIGPDAGSPSDPFNQSMTAELVSHLQSALPHTDWTWFDAFFSALHPPTPTQTPIAGLPKPLIATQNPNHSSPSSVFLAFEHHRFGPTVPKAYFVPSTRSLSTLESPLSVVTKALTTLPTHSSDLTTSFPAYTHLVNFLHTHPLGQDLSLIFLAIDCVPAPQESRLKIYLRSPRTDFASVMSILSMGGTLPHLTHPGSPHVRKLGTLFPAVLDNRPDAHRSAETHETTGMLYYFDCAPSRQLPRPKVYMPVKHYASSDASAWKALSSWLEDDRGGEYAKHWCPRFRDLLGTMGVKDLEGDEAGGWRVGKDEQGSRGRTQTYVSVGFEDGGDLNVTSYLGPAVYAKMEMMGARNC